MSRCKIYQAIEDLHLVKTNPSPNILDLQFDPRKVQINVRVSTEEEQINTDWDVIQCSSFVTDIGKFTSSIQK